MKTSNSATSRILFCSGLLICLLLCACTASEQATSPENAAGMSGSAAGDPLEGVWRLQSLITESPDGNRHQWKHVDGLLMFINGHHSMMLIHSDEPRMPFADRFNATDGEKVAAFDTSTANTGTYETSNGKLTTHPVAAKNPGFSGGRGEYDFRIEADTLYLTSRGVYWSTGDQIMPGQNTQSVEYTFARVN